MIKKRRRNEIEFYVRGSCIQLAVTNTATCRRRSQCALFFVCRRAATRNQTEDDDGFSFFHLHHPPCPQKSAAPASTSHPAQQCDVTSFLLGQLTLLGCDRFISCVLEKVPSDEGEKRTVDVVGFLSVSFSHLIIPPPASELLL